MCSGELLSVVYCSPLHSGILALSPPQTGPALTKYLTRLEHSWLIRNVTQYLPACLRSALCCTWIKQLIRAGVCILIAKDYWDFIAKDCWDFSSSAPCMPCCCAMEIFLLLM